MFVCVIRRKLGKRGRHDATARRFLSKTVKTVSLLLLIFFFFVFMDFYFIYLFIYCFYLLLNVGTLVGVLKDDGGFTTSKAK